MGTVIALGGGRFDNGEMYEVARHIKERTGKKHPYFVFIPTAGSDDISGDEHLSAVLKADRGAVIAGYARKVMLLYCLRKGLPVFALIVRTVDIAVTDNECPPRRFYVKQTIKQTLNFILTNSGFFVHLQESVLEYAQNCIS